MKRQSTFNHFSTIFMRVALHNAIRTSNIDDVKRLIKEGSDVNLKCPNCFYEHTPLMTSVCITRNTNITKLLLENGADVNIRDTSGMTALHKACLNGNDLDVYHLLNYGADHTVFDIFGETAVHKAIRFSDNTHVKNLVILHHLLLGGADLDLGINKLYSPCMLAVYNEKYDIACFLITIGCKVPFRLMHKIIKDKLLFYYATNPISLSALCRKAIWKWKSGNTKKFIKDIHYPRCLKDYVLFSCTNV